MAIEYNSDGMYETFKLTDKQILACKKVYKAIREADKLGVQFWDMYGTLSAYNGKVFISLHMQDTDNSIQVINCKGNELIYSEQLKNFHAGCSDDDVWAEVRSSFLK